MKIKVEMRDNILSNRIFWDGDETEIEQIKNSVAKKLAKKVIQDGKSRQFGIWFVYEAK